LELPLAAARWLVNVMEYGFHRKPSEGSILKSRISTAETIAGEDLCIYRAVALVDDDIGGFVVGNNSRPGYVGDSSDQEHGIADKVMMMEGGYLSAFKEIAVRYERGEFGPPISG
jgi:hypothetical protein